MGRSLRVRDIVSNADLHKWLLSFAGENGYCIARTFGYNRKWARICYKNERGAQGDVLLDVHAFIVYFGVDAKRRPALKVRPLDRTVGLTVFFEKLKDHLETCKKKLAFNGTPHNARPEEGGAESGPHLWYELIADEDLERLNIDPTSLQPLPTRWRDLPYTGGAISEQMQGHTPKREGRQVRLIKRTRKVLRYRGRFRGP